MQTLPLLKSDTVARSYTAKTRLCCNTKTAVKPGTAIAVLQMMARNNTHSHPLLSCRLCPAEFYEEHYGVGGPQDSALRILDVALGAAEGDCKVMLFG